MAYVLTLIAVLAAFLWATPAHTLIADNFRASTRAVEEAMASPSISFSAAAKNAIGSVRAKAMELLREELHRSVDSLVR